SNFGARDPDASGGGWFRRPTVERLLTVLDRPEAERLQAQDPTLADRLIPGILHPHQPEEAFAHHSLSLLRLIQEVTNSLGPEQSFGRLLSIYDAATLSYPAAQAASGFNASLAEWIEPFRVGLRLYGESEGWV